MIEFDSPDKFIGTTAALILGGLAAGGAIGGAKIAANASENAAQTQSTAAKTAADYSAGQTSKAFDYINSLRATAQPGTANSSAYATLQRLTGGSPAPAPMSAPSPVSGGYSALFGGAGGAPVLMRSPDGQSTRMVPPDQVDHFRQQGAQIVPNGGGSNVDPRMRAF